MNHKEQDIKHTDTYINHTATEKWEFALQKRLKQCSPSLHRNYLEASTGACMMLDRYRNVFPQYTDHSSLHCLNIMNLAGQLVGDCLLQLNGSELYVLLTGILFHDLGMGISKADFEGLAPVLCGELYPVKGREAELIREYHQEFSALLVEKYSDIFEIRKEYVFPVMQAVRGHRKTDLWDENAFPAAFQIGTESVCLPYIAGIIRLADEMDLCRDRNSTLGGEEQMISDSYSRLVWRTHDTVTGMELTEKECILYAEGGGRDTWEELGKWTRKLQKTMDEVEQVITCRTPFFLPKRMVRIDKITPWLEQCQDITSET